MRRRRRDPHAFTLPWTPCLLLALSGCVSTPGEVDTTGSTGAGETTEAPGSETEPAGSGDSSGAEPGMSMLEGRAEKGPMILGSTVTASVLDATGSPSGDVFIGMIDDDAGSFSIALPTGLVGLLTEGFYFDEVAGSLSVASLSLRGTAVVPPGGGTSRVNVLTHLRDARAVALIAAGTDPALALIQAADECVQALEVGAGVIPMGAFDALGIFGGGTLDDAYLLAVSATLIAATDGSTAQVQQLLNTLADDLADDGLLDPSHLPGLRDGESSVNASEVLSNLAAYAASVGSMWVEPPLDDVLDLDHDGVANAQDNCLGVPNPMQEDADGDGVGDACLDCADPALPDSDADGVPDPCDNCPMLQNVAQVDSDGDGMGNVCDPCALLPGDVGDACCDPRDPALWCEEPDIAIQNTRCGDFGSGFACNGIYNGVVPTGQDCSISDCAVGPCAAPGVMPVVANPVNLSQCAAGDNCCSAVCTTTQDDCGPHPDVHCIPWFAAGTAPVGLDDLGLCVDTTVGPCSAVGAVGSACAGAVW